MGDGKNKNDFFLIQCIKKIEGGVSSANELLSRGNWAEIIKS